MVNPASATARLSGRLMAPLVLFIGVVMTTPLAAATDRSGVVADNRLDKVVGASPISATEHFVTGNSPSLFDIDISADNRRAYGVSIEGGLVKFRIDVGAAPIFTDIGSVPLPLDIARPRHIAISPDGRLAYVAERDTIGVVNVVPIGVPGEDGNTIVEPGEFKAVSVPNRGQEVLDIKVTPDGERLIALLAGARRASDDDGIDDLGHLAIYEISGKVPNRFDAEPLSRFIRVPLGIPLYQLKSMAISPDGNYVIIIARGDQGVKISPFGVRPETDNRTGGVIVFDLNTFSTLQVFPTTLKGENTTFIERVIAIKGFYIKHPTVIAQTLIANASQTAADAALGLRTTAGASFAGFALTEALVNEQIRQQFEEIYKDYGPMAAYANAYPTDMVSGSAAAITNHGDFGLVTFQDTNNIGFLNLRPSDDVRGYNFGNRPDFFFSAATKKIINALDLSFGINGILSTGGAAAFRTGWFYMQEAAVTTDDSHAYIGMNGGISTGDNTNVFGLVNLNAVRREIALDFGISTQSGLPPLAHVNLHGKVSVGDTSRPEFSSPRDVATFHGIDTDGDGLSNLLEAFNRFNDYRSVPFGDKTQLVSTSVYNITDPSTTMVSNLFPFNHNDIGYFLPHSGVGYRYNYNRHLDFTTNVGSSAAVTTLETVGREWYDMFLDNLVTRPYFLVTDMSHPGESLIQNELGEFRHFNVRNGFQANIQYFRKESDDPFEFVLSNGPSSPLDNTIEGDPGDFDSVHTAALIDLFLDQDAVAKIVLDPRAVDIIGGDLVDNPRLEIHGSTDPNFPFTRRDMDAFMMVVFRRGDIAVDGATIVGEHTDGTPLHLVATDADGDIGARAVKFDITEEAAATIRIVSGPELAFDNSMTQPVPMGEPISITDTNGVFWMDIDGASGSSESVQFIAELLDRDGAVIRQISYRAGVVSLELDVTNGSIPLNDVDSDGDQVPGYADGFNFDLSISPSDGNGNLVPDDADDMDSASFTPLEITIDGPIDFGTEPLIRFDYDVSNPAQIFTFAGSSPGGGGREPTFLLPRAGSLRLWRRDGSEERHFSDFIPATSFPLDSLGFTGTGGSVTVFIEAVKPTANTVIRVSLDPDGFNGPASFVVSQSIMVSTLGTDELDLKIDSNNNGSIEASDDDVEDIANENDAPGRIISVNNTGVSGSNLPGYADFSGTTSRKFAVLELDLPTDIENPDNAIVAISYSASDPRQVSTELLGIAGLVVPGGGHLRLWRNDGNAARSETPAPDGDYFAPGQYRVSDLPAGGVFYVEGVAPSSDIADQRIVVQLDPDGFNGPEGFIYQDAVRLTIYDQLWEDTYALDAAHRRLDVNGHPMPESEPQAESQRDQSKNNFYVDAYTLTPTYSTTDISIPLLGPEMRLEFRRTMSTGGYVAQDSAVDIPINPVREDIALGKGWRSVLGMRVVHEFGLFHVYDDNGQAHRYNAGGQPVPHSFLETTTHRTDLQIIPNESLADVVDAIIWTRNFWTQYQFVRYTPDPADFGRRPVSGQVFRLASITSRNGNAILFEYPDETSSYPARIYESGFEEKQVLFSYTDIPDQGIRLESLTDPNGNIYEYEYDGGGNLARVNKPDPGAPVGSPPSGVTAETYTYTITPTATVDEGLTTVFFALESITNAAGNTTTLDYEVVDRALTEYEDNVKALQLRALTTADGSPDQTTATFAQPLLATDGAMTEVIDNRGTAISYEFVTRLLPSSLQNGLGYGLNGFTIATLNSMRRTIGTTTGDKIWNFDFSNDTFCNLVQLVDCFGTITDYEYGKHKGFDHSRYNRPLRRTLDPVGLNLITQFEYDFVSRKLARTIRPKFFIENPEFEDLYSTAYEYDENRNVVSSRSMYVDGDGNMRMQATSVKYDDRGLPIVRIDPDGRVTSTERAPFNDGWEDVIIRYREYADGDNSDGRLAETISLGSMSPWLTRRITYDLNGNMTEMELEFDDPDFPGGTIIETTTYSLDAANNVTEILQPSVPDGDSAGADQRYVIAKEFNGVGQVTREVDGRGTETTYEYDARERVIATTTITEDGPLTVVQRHDAAGNTIFRAQPLGNETTMEYDELNRMVRKTDQNKYTDPKTFESIDETLETLYEFGNFSGSNIFTNDRWSPTVIVDQRGFPTVNTYDRAFRITGTRRFANESTGFMPIALPAESDNDQVDEFLVDADGNMIEKREFNPLGSGTQVTLTTFDELDRVIRTEIVLDDGPNIVTEFAYDNAGNIVRTIDPEQNVILEEYNALNALARRVISMDGDMGFTDIGTYHYAIDNATVEPEDIVVSFDYDGKGNKIRESLLRRDYESMDEFALIELASEMRYDALNRMITMIQNSDGSPAEGDDELIIRYLYDANGNKRFESIGRTSPGSGVELIETDFEYDSVNRLVRTTLPAVRDAESGEESVNGVVVRTYDLNSNLCTETDARGMITEYVYDGLNRPVCKIMNLDSDISGIGPGDVVERHRYDASNNIVESSEERTGSVLTTTFEYDAFGRLMRIVNAESHANSAEFDNQDNIISRTDANGNRTDLTYDQANRLVRIEKPQVLAHTPGASGAAGAIRPTVVLEYDLRGLLIRMVDENGHETEMSYDAAQRQVRSIDALDQEAFTEFDQAGNVSRSIDFRGNAMTIAYDRFNRPSEITDPDGFTSHAEYDVTGNLIRKIDERGNETVFTYDLMNRRIAELRPGNSTPKTFIYNLNGQLVIEIDELGFEKRTDFDLLGRVSGKTDDAGKSTGIIRDQLGNVTSRIDASGATTLFEYDHLNRMIRMLEEFDKVTEFEYDANGNRTRIIDANGFETMFEYDALNRLTRHTYPTGDTYEFEYDRQTNVVVTTTPNGQEIEQIYDGLNRLSTKSYENHDFTFTYDANSNPLTMTQLVDHPASASAEEFRIVDDYDDRNQLISRTFEYPGLLARTTSYTYDASGNRSMMVTPDGREILYGYNGRDLITTIHTESNGVDGGTWSSITYDPGSDTTTLTAVDDGMDLWMPDELAGKFLQPSVESGAVFPILGNTTNSVFISGDLTGTVAPGQTFAVASHSVRFEYDEADRTIAKNYSNRTRTSTVLNNLDLILEQSVTNRDSGDHVVVHQYGYNGVDNRLFEKEFFAVPGENDPVGNADVYRYDLLHRVTGVKYNVPASLTANVTPELPPQPPGSFESITEPPRSQFFDLDLLHNRRAITGTEGPIHFNNLGGGYEADPFNRITSLAQFAFTDGADAVIFDGQDDDIEQPPANNTPGTNGPLLFNDANSNGTYDAGEDIWGDSPGGVDGQYDPGVDTSLVFFDSDEDSVVHGGTVPEGSIGAQDGMLFYYDQNMSGEYDFGEDVWYDRDSVLGVYDRGSDELLIFYSGDQDTIVDGPPDLADGAVGTIEGLYYFDVNDDGIYNIGEAIWSDETDSTFDAGPDGVPGTSDDVDTLIFAGIPGTPIHDDMPGLQENLVYFDASGNGSWDPGEAIWRNFDLSRNAAEFAPARDVPVYDGDVPPDISSPLDNFSVEAGAVGANETLYYHDENGNGRFDPGEDIWAGGETFNAGADTTPGTADDVDTLIFIGDDGLQLSHGTVGGQSRLYYHDDNNDFSWNPGEDIWAKTSVAGVAGSTETLFCYDDDNNQTCDPGEPIWKNNHLDGIVGNDRDLFFGDTNLNGRWDTDEAIWLEADGDDPDGDDVTLLTYDANGNLTQQGAVQYEWTADNHLERILDGGEVVVRYVYDHDGNRLAKIHGDGTRTYYFYDHVTVLTETTESNAVTARFMPGRVLDEHIAAEINDQALYFHQNAIGNVVAVTDSAGHVVQRYSYDVYGLARVHDPDGTVIGGADAAVIPYLFTGRRYDTELGLYYFRARYYSSQLGRFISPDPLDYIDGMNVYAYVNGNVVNITDPMGLSGFLDFISLFSPANIWRAITSPNFLDNIVTGLQAVGNAAVDTVLGFVSFGQMSQATLFGNSFTVFGGQDKPGYAEAYGIARIGTELAFGLATGALSTLGGLGRAVMLVDIAGNFVAAQSAVSDMVANGFSWSNGIQLGGALFGVVGNFSGARGPRNAEAVSPPKVAPEVSIPRAVARTDHLASLVSRAKSVKSLKGKVRALEDGGAGFTRTEAFNLIRRGKVCFIAGTQVVTLTGLIPIEQLVPGELVLSQNPNGNGKHWAEVTAAFSRETSELYEITVVSEDGDNQTLTCTGVHPFWTVDNGWIPAEGIQEGDRLVNADGGVAMVVNAMSYRGPPDRPFTVHNIEVTGTHSYFALAPGHEDSARAIWTHNDEVCQIDELTRLRQGANHIGRADAPAPPRSDKALRRAGHQRAAKDLDNTDTGGHSYADHGAHVTPQQHLRRLKTGVAPSNRAAAIPDASGSFATNKAHAAAYQRARQEIWKQPTIIVGKGAGQRFWTKPVFEFDLKGAGFSYSLDGVGNLVRAKADRVRAVFKLNSAGTDYELVTMFPVK